MATWEANLTREREEKDQFFTEHPHSPIPRNQRDGFDGLGYFPPDASLRFELNPNQFDDHETLTVETTQDGTQMYLRWGEFQFEMNGETLSLTAYKSDPDEDRLWVPFRDETNGEETYGAGRYLDLESGARTDGGSWILDFNRAYSPFCAYNDAYECPLVPMENWLDVRIEAGEKALEA